MSEQLAPKMVAFFAELEKIAAVKEAGLVDGAGFALGRLGIGVRNAADPLKRASQLNFFQKALRKMKSGTKGVFSPGMKKTKATGDAVAGTGQKMVVKAPTLEGPAQQVMDLAL